MLLICCIIFKKRCCGSISDKETNIYILVRELHEELLYMLPVLSSMHPAL